MVMGASGAAGGGSEPLRLRLYIADRAPHSLAARANLKAVLGRYGNPGLRVELEVIDVLKQPQLAARGQVVITPTLVRIAPVPEVRIVGNLADHAAVARLLGLVRP